MTSHAGSPTKGLHKDAARKSFHVASLTTNPHPMDNSISLASTMEAHPISIIPIDEGATGNPVHDRTQSLTRGGDTIATSTRPPSGGGRPSSTSSKAGALGGNSPMTRPSPRSRMAVLAEPDGTPTSRAEKKGQPMSRLSSAAGDGERKRRVNSAARAIMAGGPNYPRADMSEFDNFFSHDAVPSTAAKNAMAECTTSNFALRGYNKQYYNMENFTSSAAMALRSKQEHRSLQVHKEAMDVLDTYARQRKAFQGAAQLSSDMRTRVEDIAEHQELYGEMNTVDHGELVSDIESQLNQQGSEEGDGGDADRIGDTHGSVGDMGSGGTSGAGGLEFGVNENEEDFLLSETREKSKKMQRLRAMQRTLIGMDEAEEEERRKQQASVTRSRTGLNNNSSNPDVRSAASGQANTAREVRDVFEGMFDAKHSSDLPPDPPKVFTTIALGTTIEYMTESLSTIIDATDVICITATFKGKDESAVITPAVQALQKHMPYLRHCYAVALSHLTHFEAGEKAVLEGGGAEVNALREQFLKCKEGLTTDQQKEQMTTEVLNGLNTRLANHQKRIDLYEKMVTLYEAHAAGDIDVEHDPQEDSAWSITVPTYYYVNPHRRSGARTSSMSSRSMGSLQRGGGADDLTSQHGEPDSFSQLMAGGGGADGGAGGRRSLSRNGGRYSAAAAPMQGYPVTNTAVNGSGNNHADGYKGAAAYSYLGHFLNPTAPRDGAQLPMAMEDRIASTWGNPYLKGQRALGRAVGDVDGTAHAALTAHEGGPPHTPAGAAALSPASKEERTNRAPSDGASSAMTSRSNHQRDGMRPSSTSRALGGGPSEEEVFLQERTVILLQALLGQLNAANTMAEGAAAAEGTATKPPPEDTPQEGDPPPQEAASKEEVAARKQTKASVQRLVRFLLNTKKVTGT